MKYAKAQTTRTGSKAHFANVHASSTNSISYERARWASVFLSLSLSFSPYLHKPDLYPVYTIKLARRADIC